MELLSIRVEWSENAYLHEMSIKQKNGKARVFNSFVEFDDELKLAAISVPKNTEGEKLNFVVKHNELGTYKGNLSLLHFSKPQQTSTRLISLKQHIIDHCNKVVNDNYVGYIDKEYKTMSQSWLDFLKQKGN